MIGSRLGRYVLGRVLGEGAQGRVHEAVLLGPGGLRKPVAVKVLDRGEGLAREARLGGLLRHPHLVDVYEVGEVDGTWFLAMELCEGGTLADLDDRPGRERREVGLQVAAALGYAHEALGLVHLDLKPKNLLLADGVAKVADLGIAHASGFERGPLGGTSGYMAPEQRAGLPVDARTDVHALGVTLHELATGAVPTSGPTFSLDEEATDVLDPADATPCPAWLAPVVARCTEPDPDARFASMAEVAAALASLRVDGPGLAELAPRRERAPDPTASGTVGRDALALELDDRLARPGAVTVWGPPGIGKSRLALDAAERFRTTIGQRAWVCDLSEATTLADLARGVGAALGVHLVGRDEVGQVGHALRARGRVLLVLDGLDRVREGASALATWRASAPDLRLVITTREAPANEGDRLEVPPLAEEAAIELLALRARSRGVELLPGEAERELARRLDGVPLALELAAGRLGVLSTAELVARLDTSLLRSGEAGRPERQATLRGALDWSAALLDANAGLALEELSVFRGGFTLEAARAVLSAGRDVDRLVAALRDRSLVALRDGRPRLLEPVRAWAWERLAGRDAVLARHARWFGRLGASDAIDAHDASGAEGRAALAVELDNLLLACRAADPGAASGALRAAWEVLRARGPLRGVVELAEEVLARPDLAGADRARALRVLGSAHQLVGDLVAARRHLEQALPLYRAVSDASGEARLLDQLGDVARGQGRLGEARSLLEAGLRGARAARDRRGEAASLANLGLLESDEGRAEPARRAYERAIRLHRANGDLRREATILGNLAIVHHQQGRRAEARRAYEACLAIARALGERRMEAMTLANQALLAGDEGRPAESRALLERALAAHRAIGNRRSEGIAIGNLGRLLHDEGRLDEARAAYEGAIAIHRELANRPFEGLVLGNLGVLCCDLGRVEDGIRALEESLAVHREAGNRRSEGLVLGSLARAVSLRGELALAVEHLERGERLLREVGDRVGLADHLRLTAEIAVLTNDRPRFDGCVRDLDALVVEVGAEPESRIGRARARVAATAPPGQGRHLDPPEQERHHPGAAAGEER